VFGLCFHVSTEDLETFSAVDPQVLDTFRKNYEYYEQNPKAKETLRLTNPAKYEVLMSYYRSYAHLMPPVQPAATVERPSSRASVGSGRHLGQVRVQGSIKTFLSSGLAKS